MLKKVIKSTLVLAFVAAMSGCTTSSGPSLEQKRIGMTLHGVAGDQDEPFMQMIENLETIDFVVSDPHEHINDAYVEKYGSTKLDNLGFFSSANDKKLRMLLEKYPQIGGFSPFNLHVYKKKTENMTWVGHIEPSVMLDIVGVTDKAARAEFIEMFQPLDKKIIEYMKPTTQKNIEFSSLPVEPMMTFEFDVEGSVSDFVDEFQESFEEAFEEKKYIIAGFKNIKEAYDDMELEFSYDAYWVYSLCHFKFSNSIFNDRPEAGAFAPCSVYMYIKNGKMHVGMPKLENWINVIGLVDSKKIKAVRDLDQDVIDTFIELGGKKIKG